MLQNDISEISKLEPFIGNIGEELELPPDVVYNLNLALEEAVSNIVLYAYPGKTGQDITGRICLSQDSPQYCFIQSSTMK